MNKNYSLVLSAITNLIKNLFFTQTAILCKDNKISLNSDDIFPFNNELIFFILMHHAILTLQCQSIIYSTVLNQNCLMVKDG